MSLRYFWKIIFKYSLWIPGHTSSGIRSKYHEGTLSGTPLPIFGGICKGNPR